MIEFPDSGLPGWIIILISVFLGLLLLVAIVGFIGSVIKFGLW